MHILVTGGAGYIGSHTVLELLNIGHTVTVIDNLSNSRQESLKRVNKLTKKKVSFYAFDLCNIDKLQDLFKINSFDAVIHFAGLKVVGDSIANPLSYYENNLLSTINLLNVMSKENVKKLVFSSSANIYGLLAKTPIKEKSPKGPSNPYGQTKLMIEQMLEDTVKSDSSWNITSLRYFNPVGAHKSGKIGEDPNGIPTNLLPYITQVAVGKLKTVKVFGNDYPTPDGTGIRDYIHVVDLAKAHIAAINSLGNKNAYMAYNIGTGVGVSVLEAIKTMSDVTGINIPYEIKARRDLDIAVSFADVSLAKEELGWSSELTFKNACEDAWRWQSANPNGYSIVRKN